MTGLRSMLGSMFLMTAILVFGQTSPLPKVASATDASAPCNLGSLPSDVQNHLKSDFGSWKIQEPESLTDHARKAWAGKKPPACPGIAVGLFQSAKTPSYAVLLVPVDHPEGWEKFLNFPRKTQQPFYEKNVCEQVDRRWASNYFFRKVPINK